MAAASLASFKSHPRIPLVAHTDGKHTGTRILENEVQLRQDDAFPKPV